MEIHCQGSSQTQTLKRTFGFTLIEIIVAITIVTILSTLGFISFSSYITDGNDFKRISDIALIKAQLEVYRKNHGLYYPTGSGYTSIMSGSETVAQEYLFDQYLIGQIDIAQVPLDPKSRVPYLYSIKTDKLSYQISATLENKNNLVSYSPIENVYAANNTSYTAYVNGTFIPTNKLALPGLLYATMTGAKFTPGNPLTFNINTSTGIARVILNGQSVNLPYDLGGKMIANDGTLSLTGLLATTTLVEKIAGSQAGGTNCPGIQNPTQSFFGGENEVWPYLNGTTLGSRIGWKYKVCDGATGNMTPNNLTASVTDWNYICTSIVGGVFDATCNWTSCSSGYTAVTSGSGAPSCKANLLAPTLAYPQNGAYGLPIDGSLAWNSVVGSNGIYTVYFGTTSTPSVVYYSGSNLSTTFSSLLKGTNYYWKVMTCDSGSPQQCNTSTIGSFTTVNDAVSGSGGGGGGGGSGTGSTPVNNFCPTEPDVPCQVLAPEITVTYVGCSSNAVESSYTDCSLVQNSFGTSERKSDNFYGTQKVIAYKIANTSNGSAYFKIKIGDTIASAVEKPISSGFDTDQAYDLGGEGIANNFYWKGVSGCYATGNGDYKILGQSTCWINFYGRSDSSWPTVLGNIFAFQVINTDSINGFWSHTGVNMSGKTALYASSPLTFTYSSGSKQTLEPSASGAIDNFGTSTRIGTGGTYGYWKSLTYTINNPDPLAAYFKVFLSGEGVAAQTALWIKPTSSSSDPNSNSTFDAVANPGAVYDLGSNSVGNLVWVNGDPAGLSPCSVSLPNTNGFTIPAAGSCKVTLYTRGDEYFPNSNQDIIGITLKNQTISNYTYVSKKLKGNGQGWINYFNQYVWSEMLGWIRLKLDTSGPTVHGYGESEIYGWICFENTCGANLTRDGSTGKLSGYAYSEMLGWINVDNVYLKNDDTVSGYAQGELAGWIRFN